MRARASQRPYNVEYYRRNRDLELQRVRVRQSGMVELLRDLRRVPCADCGGRFKPWQMDFDHRDPATKSFTITTGRAMLMSTERIKAEVAKCDVVCANCHRVRSRMQHQRRLVERVQGTSKRLPAQRARWRRQAAMLDELRNVPCADCGRRFEPYQMDFDHLDPATKRSMVPALIGRAGEATILAEAAKCDIVCANCHRERTHRRRTRVDERE
jgi:hypothetical protein